MLMALVGQLILASFFAVPVSATTLHSQQAPDTEQVFTGHNTAVTEMEDDCHQDQQDCCHAGDLDNCSSHCSAVFVLLDPEASQHMPRDNRKISLGSWSVQTTDPESLTPPPNLG